MTELVVLRGLPACGKTTRARKWVDESPQDRVRVGRDDIRMMLHNGVFIKGVTEQVVIKMRDKLIEEALCSGISVISDDTNLPSRTVKDLMRLAKRCGAELVVEDMSGVSPAVCAERNDYRIAGGKHGVPEEVIWSMWSKYVEGNAKRGKKLPVPVVKDTCDGSSWVKYTQDFSKPAARIYDIDGTLAHMNGRSPYDYSLVHTDTVDEAVRGQLEDDAYRGYEIIVMSGRPDSCENATVKWLEDNNIYPDLLLMRPAGDSRDDAQVKYELFDKHVRDRYNVTGVFDDRNRVVAMWRSIGLTCYQVAEGNF